MPGPLTLAKIATQLGGSIAGDAGVLITQVGSLERAGRGQIAFLSNARYRDRLAATGASAVILRAEHENPTTPPPTLFDNPYPYFPPAAPLLKPRSCHAQGVHPPA